MTQRRSFSVLCRELGLPEAAPLSTAPALSSSANVGRAFATAPEPIVGDARAGRGPPRLWAPAFVVNDAVTLERNANAPEQVRLRFLDLAPGLPAVEAIHPFFDDVAGFAVDAEDPVVVLDFRAGEAFFVDWNATRYLVAPADASPASPIHVAAYDVFALASGERCTVPVFVADWLAAAPREDAWLAEHIRALAADGRASSVVAAVGAWARLRSRTAADNADIVARALRGEVDDAFVAPNRWAREFLVGGHRDAVVRQAIGACGRLAEELGNIFAADPSDAATWRRFAEALRDRDDLESTRVMLHVVDAAADVERCSVDVDAAGHDLVLSLPVEPSLAADDHIVRVAVRMPDLWWGRPARVE